MTDERILLNEFMDAAVLDHGKARKLLNEHPELLHKRTSIGETALYYLVVENYLEGVRFLIDAGADVNAENNFGDIPIMSAAQLGYEEMVKLLIASGANLHAVSKTRGSVLHCAATSGNVNVVCILADIPGSNIDVRDDVGETPLMCAARTDSVEVVRYFLEKGANPNVKTGTDGCALTNAISSGHPNVVEALIQGGAKCDDVSELWDAVKSMSRERKRSEIVAILQRDGLIP